MYKRTRGGGGCDRITGFAARSAARLRRRSEDARPPRSPVEMLERRVLLSASARASDDSPVFRNSAAVEWQGQSAYVEPGQWILTLETPAADGGTEASFIDSAEQLIQARCADVSVIDRIGLGSDLGADRDARGRHLRRTDSARCETSKASGTSSPISSTPPTATPNDPRFGVRCTACTTPASPAARPTPTSTPPRRGTSPPAARTSSSASSTPASTTPTPTSPPTCGPTPARSPATASTTTATASSTTSTATTSSTNDGNPMDDHGHGTHVAGTIAAVGNNGVGVAGVNWNAKVMALKFLDADGTGTTADAIEAVNYATMMRSRGVNIRADEQQLGRRRRSTGAAGRDRRHRQRRHALRRRRRQQHGSNNDVVAALPVQLRPAQRHLRRRHRPQRRSACFSNYGATTVDLAAPGVDILSTALIDAGQHLGPQRLRRRSAARRWRRRTSSGVAALAWSSQPGATYQQVRDAIYAGGDPVASMAGRTVTGKRLNAFGTLQQLGLAVAGSTPGRRRDLSRCRRSISSIDFLQPLRDRHRRAGRRAAVGPDGQRRRRQLGRPDRRRHRDVPLQRQPRDRAGPADDVDRRRRGARAADASPVAAWNATFRYDAVTMQVASTNPGQRCGRARCR